jgi:cbb3-type cytochrome oxidase subunit 3
MIQKVLSGIGGVGVYGVIAVVLFFVVFVGVVVWALSLRATEVERLSRLPLEDDPEDRVESSATVQPDSCHE